MDEPEWTDHQLIEMAWYLLATAHGGDLNTANDTWRNEVYKWHRQYQQHLQRHLIRQADAR